MLTLKWIMRRARPGDDVTDGPGWGPNTVIRDAIARCSTSDKPIRVVSDGKLLGMVGRGRDPRR